VYVLKHKSDVLEKFKEWKVLVETLSGHTLKMLRTDNGGEYCSKEFEGFCKREGVHHELTTSKTPE
jgi:transposase InsO family protein